MKIGLNLWKVLGDTALTCTLVLWAESIAQWWSASCLPSMCKVLDMTSSASEQNQTSLPVWHRLYLPLSWHPQTAQTGMQWSLTEELRIPSY